MLEEHHSWELLVLFCKGWIGRSYRLTCASQAQATSASDIYWKNIWQHSEAVFKKNIYYWINDVSAWLILTHISLLKTYGYFPFNGWENQDTEGSALELGFKHTVQSFTSLQYWQCQYLPHNTELNEIVPVKCSVSAVRYIYKAWGIFFYLWQGGFCFLLV